MKQGIQLLPVGLALLALPSCESITGVVPKGTPRVEVELAVLVEESFLDALVDVDMDSELVAAVKQAVLEKADFGLRFYATPSESYGAGDRRPPYLMTVELDALSVVFDHEMIEKEEEEPRIETSVDEIHCSVSASVERRREDAPSLVVARSSAAGRVSAERSSEVIEAEPGYTPVLDGAAPKVLRKDIVRAVHAAMHKALAAMRTPIDREFAPAPEAESL